MTTRASNDAGAPALATDAAPTANDAATVPTRPKGALCDYGSVPDAMPPAAWNDNPTLTPWNIHPYGTPQVTLSSGYIQLSEGPRGPMQVPMDTQRMILQRINADLAFETATTYLQMPSWTQGKTPHFIDYFLVDTGLPNDPNAGGNQGWEGNDVPDVFTMQVAMTDPSQRFDLTHEFIHVLQSSYGTFGSNVGWLHESHNDYLIMLLAEHEGGGTFGQSAQFMLPSNVAYLDALVYEQNFVPIESCGIAVKDGSKVNGPGDFDTDITGYRYNDLFPLFVAQRVSPHLFAQLWASATTKEQVLQTMARLLDRERVHCMVGDYAVRVALADFGEFSASIQQRASAAMYVETSAQGDWLAPKNTLDLPRYTGRNFIPIALDASATSLRVEFAPDAKGSAGTPAHMQLQLAYRADDRSIVTGAPVSTGSASITLEAEVASGAVIAVVTNLTLDGFAKPGPYGWDPDETFGYKVRITGGHVAPNNKKYF